jgi:hypothetical protein
MVKERKNNRNHCTFPNCFIVEKQNIVQKPVNQKHGLMVIDGGVLRGHTVATLLIQPQPPQPRLPLLLLSLLQLRLHLRQRNK